MLLRYFFDESAYSNGLAMVGSCSASTIIQPLYFDLIIISLIALKSIQPSPGTVKVPLKTDFKNESVLKFRLLNTWNLKSLKWMCLIMIFKTLITARGNSKSIPKINIININNKPLISYSIKANRASYLDETWVCNKFIFQ